MRPLPLLPPNPACHALTASLSPSLPPVQEDETPVPAAALHTYSLVFDAVYTPLHTRLLREAADAGCRVVTGDEMFVGQAADQFRLFTGLEPPVGLMRQALHKSLEQR